MRRIRSGSEKARGRSGEASAPRREGGANARPGAFGRGSRYKARVTDGRASIGAPAGPGTLGPWRCRGLELQPVHRVVALLAALLLGGVLLLRRRRGALVAHLLL